MLPVTPLDVAWQDTVPQILYGLLLIGLVLTCVGYVFISVTLRFRAYLQNGSLHSKLSANASFICCTLILALTQLFAITLWAVSLLLIGKAHSWDQAFRYSASSYTTLGIFVQDMPSGWHLIPTFIAFSGLFSFAWATSSTMSMVNALTSYLEAPENQTHQAR